MEQTTHERPGVYSSYDASTVVDSRGGGKVVGLVAQSAKGTAGKAVHLGRYEDAAALFGPGDAVTELARLLFLNGAAAVVAVPVADEAGYAAAFGVLEATEGIGIVVCDATTLLVQQALRDSVGAASEARRERIGVVCGGADESVSALVTRAGELNDPRMVLVGPCVEGGDGAKVAAAVAGAIAGERDPAMPLGGALLKGLGELGALYADSEIDLLVRGGVTAVERVAGTCSVVRGVTTKTKSGTAADTTWRELSTIRIVDDVVPAVRDSLRAKFQRAKNTAQTRGAIRAQVVLELENKIGREIITGYDSVAVRALEENPEVCLVEFSFTVAHGLNQIWLTAHITV